MLVPIHQVERVTVCDGVCTSKCTEKFKHLVGEHGEFATAENFGDLMAQAGMGVLLHEQLDTTLKDLNAKKTDKGGIKIEADLFAW